MKTKTVVLSLAVAIFILNITLLLWYIFVGYQIYFHSDSAAKVLLAREIFDSGNFFPPGWNYVNGDLFVLFGHAFIIPLLAFMSAGFTVHAISGAIFAGLILYGIWLVTSLGNIPAWRRVAVVAIMASGVSGFMAENLYGQVSYGVVVFFYCYVLYFAAQYLSADGGAKLKWAISLVILLVLAYWANPKRAAVSYGLPLIAALGWLVLCSDAQDRRIYLKLIALNLSAAMGGGFLHVVTIANVNNVLGAANARWLPFDDTLKNIAFTFKGLYAQFGGLLPAGESIFSISAMYTGVRFLVASLALLLIPMAIKKLLAQAEVKLKLLALFFTFSLLAVLFLQVTTTIPDMTDPIQSSRYLVPSTIMGLTALLIVPHDRTGDSPLWSVSVAIMGIVFISSAFHTYRMVGLNSELLSQPGQISPSRRELLATLKEKRLQYGYATYWNAGALSVLSNEQIKVRQIVAHNGLPMPMKHLSSDNWYRPSGWRGKSFLLLSDNELAHFNLSKMESLGMVPVEQTRSNNFTIYVFPDNIARHLPGWDTRYDEPARFLPTAGTPSQTGRLMEHGAKTILIAEKGEAGALHFGPYIDVEPGRYRVTFDVTAEHHSAGSVRLDVAAAPDQKIYGERTLLMSSGTEVIEFTLDRNRTMEFRVWALGNGRVIFNGVSIQRVVEER